VETEKKREKTYSEITNGIRERTAENMPELLIQ
jgi:hypothetical protein